MGGTNVRPSAARRRGFGRDCTSRDFLHLTDLREANASGLLSPEQRLEAPSERHWTAPPQSRFYTLALFARDELVFAKDL